MTSVGNIINTTLSAYTWKEPRTKVVVSELWAKQPVILKLFRRFGCPLCRYEAKVMSDYKPEFDRLGAKMVAIGFDEVGLEEWVEGKFWRGELYMDPEKKLYNFFGLRSMGFLEMLWSFKDKDFRNKVKEAKSENVGGNLTKGNGFVMGGTYVIDKGGKILYAFQQQSSSDYPSLRSMMKALGGNPDLIKQDLDAKNPSQSPKL